MNQRDREARGGLEGLGVTAGAPEAMPPPTCGSYQVWQHPNRELPSNVTIIYLKKDETATLTLYFLFSVLFFFLNISSSFFFFPPSVRSVLTKTEEETSQSHLSSSTQTLRSETPELTGAFPTHGFQLE